MENKVNGRISAKINDKNLEGFGIKETIKVIEKLGIKFRLPRVTPADGNCFFEAVASQLIGQGKTVTAKYLRKRLVEKLRNEEFIRNKGLLGYKSFYSSDNKRDLESEENCWLRMLNEFEKEGTWADGLITVSYTHLTLPTNREV